MYATRFHELELDQPGTPVQELSRAPKNMFPVYTENEFKHTCTINEPFEIKGGRIQTIMI